MKSNIFSHAIEGRNKVTFLYDFHNITIEPYYISYDKNGKKVIYGKKERSREIAKFEYEKILNIKIQKHTRFSPIIPILPILN